MYIIADIIFYASIFWFVCVFSWSLSLIFLSCEIPKKEWQMIFFLFLPYTVYFIIKKWVGK